MRNPLMPARLRALSAATLLATALSSLSACAGYTPLYAPADTRMVAQNRVEIGKIEMIKPDRNVGQRRVAQRISQRLRQDFPLAGGDLDLLTAEISEYSTPLSIERTSTVQRVEVRLYADITLSKPNGEALLKTQLTTTAPYNVERTPYSTESGRTFARLTAAQNMAAEISRRLWLFYRQHPGPSADAKPIVVEKKPKPVPAAPQFSPGL